MGAIGKNHLLTNRQYGNRITLGAILTDLKLSSDPMEHEPACPPGCKVCRTVCPVKAIRDKGVIQRLCRSKAEGFNEKGYYLYWCRACREKCPNSKGENGRQKTQPIERGYETLKSNPKPRSRNEFGMTKKENRTVVPCCTCFTI